MNCGFPCSQATFWSVCHIVFTILNWRVLGMGAGTEYLLVVISTNASGYVHHYMECDAKGAQFGRQISGDDTIAACAVAAAPRDACDTISDAPLRNLSFDCIGGYFAVAMRGNCSFAQKAFQAQSAMYSGLIVYNYANDDGPVEMAADADYGPQVIVPAFSVGYDCGISLLKTYSYENGFAFYVRTYWSYNDFLRYLVPFAAVVGVCCLLMLSAMVVKLVRDRRRRNRRRLSKKHLKQIPTRAFTADDDPDTCPICLDDFQVGEILRVLPCDHAYHSNCVDPWLLKNRRVCPICKRKVLPTQGGSSQSDSDTDETPTGGPAGPSAIPSTPERTPLLIHGERIMTVGQSTFYGVYATIGDPVVTNTSPTTFSSPATSHVIVLSGDSSPDRQSTCDDPTVDVDSRQSLIPQWSIQSSTDEYTQPGFVTASSSFREGYANPNFVVDAQEFDGNVNATTRRVRGNNGADVM